MSKLFESKQKVAAITWPDAKIIFTEPPYIQYELFKLTANFTQYIETIMTSCKTLRMGIQKTPFRRRTKWPLDPKSSI